jgi:type IV pilus assembly protein PilN
MRIRLNLATKPLETHRRFIAGSGVVGFVGVIVFLSLGWHVYVARKANAEMRAKSDKIQQQVAELGQERATLEHFFALDENARLHDRAAFINSLIDARSFNWTLMFMDLEKVLPGGVHVISIEPNQEKGRVEVKLIVGAVSDDAKLKLIKALEDSKSFTHVQLVSQTRPTSGTSTDQIVMELKAEYLRT